MTTPKKNAEQPEQKPQKENHFEVKQDVGEVKDDGTVIGVNINQNLGPQTHEKIELGAGAVNAHDVYGHIITGDGNTINVTNQYSRLSVEEQAELLRQAQALFDQLPTDQLPPVRPLPNPSRPVYGRNPHFVGRESELRELAAKLKAGQNIAIAATGLGGIGKSQLAIEFAHRYGQFFAGGVYWVSMAQAETVPTELALCGARLGIDGLEQLPQPQQIELVQNAWETPLPRLLIFDNCEDEALYEQYRPKTGNCRILLTSRKGEWGGTVQPLTLRSLPRTDSIDLLTTLCPRLTPAEADQLAAELGDFPLALHLAGSYLNRYTRLAASQFVQELQSEQLHHRAMRHHRGVGVNASGHDWNVARTFELSYRELVVDGGGAVGEEPTDTNIHSKIQNQKSEIDLEVDKVALALLARAAHFAPGEPIPVELLWQTVDEEDELLLQDGVLRLVELGLLEDGERVDEAQTEPPLQMHRLLAQFVQGVMEGEVAQEAVEVTLEQDAIWSTNLYSQTLRLWVRHLKFVTDAAVARQAKKAGDLCQVLACYLDNSGDFEGARLYLEKALTIKREVLGERHPDMVVTLNNLGYLLQEQGNYEGAQLYYEEALSINREFWENIDSPYTATILNNLGYLLQGQGNYEGARLYYEEALSISREFWGDIDERNPDTANSLNGLGLLLHEQGDYEGARPYVEEALSIRREVLGERHPHTARSLNGFGELLRAQGDYVGARPYLEEALSIRQEMLGERHPDTANSLNNMGGLLQAMGDYAGARPYYEEALEICREVLGERHPETAESLSNMGGLLQAMGDYEGARPYCEEALSIFEEMLGSDHPNTKVVRGNLAYLLSQLNP